MSDTLLRHTEEGGIHGLTMVAGPNPLHVPLMVALCDRVEQLRENGAPPILLSSSHPTLFSPGWDVKRLASADRSQVAEVLGAFDALILALFSYPGPTAVAVGGHAVAGGCLVALACDLRVMASGRPRLGLAELNLGIPVPAGAMWMMQARLSGPAVDGLVLRSEGCAADRARELGLVQRAVASERLISTAERELRKLGAKSRSAYAASKAFLYERTWTRMRAAGHDQTAVFLDCWFEDETQQRIADVARGLTHP
jgi:enoyl-CoA hydratase